MKLPYRVGDTFTMPLGDGSIVDAQIVACNHHTVDIAVADLTLRVRDTALVLHRWKRVGRFGPSTTAPRAYARDDTMSPARAERIVATHLGIANLELPPLYVHNQWRPEFPHSYMRVAGRGRILDPRELPPNLEVLECSGVTLASLAFPPTLRALRLAWIPTPVDLREVAALQLQALSLEELRELRGVEALARLTTLQQLEMLGFWQLALHDVEPSIALPNLVRAQIDLGGRRKNVELYKRTNWAYPWPFEILAARRS